MLVEQLLGASDAMFDAILKVVAQVTLGWTAQNLGLIHQSPRTPIRPFGTNECLCNHLKQMQTLLRSDARHIEMIRQK